MLRQYYAQRQRGGSNPLGVGVIGMGAIYHLQALDLSRPPSSRSASCRTPWIVECFLNGIMAASRRNGGTGRWENAYIARRSDMAVVRSLRDGRRETVSVRLLVLHEDLGLWRAPNPYPTLPDLRHYRRRSRAARPAPALEQAA